MSCIGITSIPGITLYIVDSTYLHIKYIVVLNSFKVFYDITLVSDIKVLLAFFHFLYYSYLFYCGNFYNKFLQIVLQILSNQRQSFFNNDAMIHFFLVTDDDYNTLYAKIICNFIDVQFK